MLPLRELNETAEAVGRGDFSRRVEGFSNDECGELAEAFNRMTTESPVVARGAESGRCNKFERRRNS